MVSLVSYVSTREGHLDWPGRGPVAIEPLE